MHKTEILVIFLAVTVMILGVLLLYEELLGVKKKEKQLVFICFQWGCDFFTSAYISFKDSVFVCVCVLGKWEVEELKENTVPGDRGLVLKSVAKHHAMSAMLTKEFIFDDKPLIVQYEVNFQEGIDCGGAYIKLLSSSNDLNLEYFFDKTPYTIMFGPDKCGEDYKLHFIFRHKNPKTGEYDEKHAKRPDVDLKKFYLDKKTHLYTLVLKPDDTFEILIDQLVVSKGSLLEDMVPPVNPHKEIDDPSDKKPDDWDERPKIPDPNAAKPDDWDEDEPSKIEDPDAVKPEGWLDDEPQYVPDPNAEKPKDWDEEMDGEWEAPQIPNPKCEAAPGCGPWVRPMKNNPNYKGKWKAPLIDNPNYQGIWSPRKIPNPDYFEDSHPFKMTAVSAIGLELWSMTSDIYFDNFIICSEKEVADRWAADGWGLKKLVAGANEPGMFTQLLTAAEDHPWLWVLYILTLALPFKCKLILNLGELDQEGEELDDDEIELEEEKENEDTAEDGKMSKPACCLINCKDMNRTFVDCIADNYRQLSLNMHNLLCSESSFFFDNLQRVTFHS
uniref:Calmegin n=1 Tax=Amazona collaria TaxID=241587 RepID=A0A8B9J0Z9_9PSIT